MGISHNISADDFVCSDLYWLFKKNVSENIIVLENYRPTQLQYPKLYRFARLGVLIYASLAIYFGISLYDHIRTLQEKIIVLVANFDGEDTQKYRVTEELISKLRGSFYGQEEVLIVSLNNIITEQGGSELARELGEDHYADLVLWGWYAVNDVNAVLQVHVENMDEGKGYPIRIETAPKLNAAPKDFQNFSVQQEISNEIVNLVYVVVSAYYYRNGDNEQARVWLQKALSDESASDNLLKKSEALLYSGNIYSNLGEYELAVSEYTNGILSDPDRFENYYGRGSAYLKLGQYESGVLDFDKTIAINSSHVASRIKRGLCYTFLNRYAEALEDFNRAIEIDPNNAVAYIARGNVYNLIGQDVEAVADYNYAILLDDRNIDSYINRGAAYYDLGQYENSLKDLDLAISLYSLSVAAYSNRGNTFAALSRFDEAMSDFEKAINLDPNYAKTYFNRGNLYLLRGEPFLAIKDFSTAIEKDNRFAEAYFNRGLAFFMVSEFDHSVEDFMMTIKLTENSDKSLGNDAKYYIAAAYAQVGMAKSYNRNYAEAISAFDESIFYNPELLAAYHGRAVAYVMLGQQELALSDFQKIVILYKSINGVDLSYDSTYLLGLAYYDKGLTRSIDGNLEGAIESFTSSIEYCHDFDQAYYARGMVFIALERKEDAIKDFFVVLEISENDELLKLARLRLIELGVELY